MGAFRFLLALSVVLSHSGGFLGFQLAGGAFAVLIFFMVSGFLMQLVLTTRYDPAKDLKLFYGNRLLRIFPLYWVTLATSLLLSAWLYRYGTGYFSLLVSHAGFLHLGELIALVVTQIAIIGSDALLFLNITPQGLGFHVEHSSDPAMLLMINPPSWSLAIELLFYALAPFLARKRAIWTIALMIAGLTARFVLIGYSHTLTGLTADRFFPAALPFFLAGMLACRWRSTITRHRGFTTFAGVTTIICVVTIGALSVVGQRSGIPGQLFGYGFAAISFFGIPALFAFSGSPRVWSWPRRWDRELAALSYPIYLVHWQVIAAIETFLSPTPMRSALIVVTAIGFAVILTKWIEEPIDRYRARRREDRHARGGANTESTEQISVLPARLEAPV